MTSSSRARLNAAKLVAALVFIVFQANAYGETGSERVLESATFTATLYLAEIHRRADGGADAVLVLIPEDIRQRCIGKPLSFCQRLDNCTIFPDAQKCTPDLASCAPVVREECIPFGFTLADARKRKQRTAPKRLLQAIPYAHSAELFSLLSQRGLMADKPGNKELQTLDERYSVQAEVEWELWSNGESFKVMRLLQSR